MVLHGLRPGPWISVLICLLALVSQQTEWECSLSENMYISQLDYSLPTALLYEISLWSLNSNFQLHTPFSRNWVGCAKNTSLGLQRRLQEGWQNIVPHSLRINSKENANCSAKKCLFINIPSFQLVGIVHKSNLTITCFQFLLPLMLWAH